MTEELQRIIADLQRHRDTLKKLTDDVDETSGEREALYRAVDRIRSRIPDTPADLEPPPPPKPLDEPTL